jgi:septum formation protein
MHALDAAALQRYVAADMPLDCAGSYKIEARGIALFARIQGEDFSAISGLPLMTVARMLRTRGFAIP